MSNAIHFPSSPRLVRVLAVPVVLGVLAATLAIGSASGAAETLAVDAPGPVAVAEVVELVVTDTLQGTIERADERTLTAGGGVVAVPASTGPETVGVGQAAIADGQRQKTTGSGATEEPTPEPTVEPATEPTVEPATEPTVAPGATPSPAVDEACPTGEPEPDPTPEPMLTPGPGATPIPTPDEQEPAVSVGCQDAEDVGGPAPSGSAGGGADQRGGGQAGGGQTGGGQAGGVVYGSTVSGTGGAIGTVGVGTSPILTSIADVGSALDQGTVAWSVDLEPVVVLVGNDILYRDLDTAVDDGADVAVLETALVAMGYGDDLTVDTTYTSATASAVEAWETDLGRMDPDGVVTTDEVVLLDAPTTVLHHDAVVGSHLLAGTPVLSVGGTEQVVLLAAPADQSGSWAVGTPVTLLVDDQRIAGGTVTSRSATVEGGTVGEYGTRELQVTPDTYLGDRPDGAAVTISRIADRVTSSVTVPVAALVAGTDGTSAVRAVSDNGGTRLVPVQTGLVVDGRAEIIDGLAAGTSVRLPG